MLASKFSSVLIHLCVLAAGPLLGGLLGCQPPAQPAPPSRSDVTRYPNHDRPRPRHKDEAKDTHASFDYYLLNLSWSPEFCYSHPDAAECAQHRAFTLHGLWPQRMDGSYPEHCSDAPGPPLPGQYRDLFPDAGLLRHEWATHGTCSGVDPDTFFDKARSATGSVHIPPRLARLDHPISMPPEAIMSLFLASNPSLSRASLAISCGNNFLTAVEVCLSKQLQPISCGPIRSCRANTVRIPPPQP